MYAEQCAYLYLRNRNSYKLPDTMQKSDETLLKNHATLKYKYPLKINSSKLAQYSHSLSPIPSLPAFTAPCNQTRHFSSLAPHHNVQESPASTVKGSTASRTLLRQHKPKWHRLLSAAGFYPTLHNSGTSAVVPHGSLPGPNAKFSHGRGQWKVPGSSFFSKAVKINCHQLSESLRAGYYR